MKEKKTNTIENSTNTDGTERNEMNVKLCKHAYHI